MATVQTQDIMPVRSRVSWAAVLAGAVTALSVYLLFGALGVALGLSVQDRVTDTQLGVGVAIWGVLTLLIALFLGGWVTSQCTVGENKSEAVIYGVILWGVVFTMLLWFMAANISFGFNAVMRLASAPAGSPLGDVSQDQLRAYGFTPEQIKQSQAKRDEYRANPNALPNELRRYVEDPRTTEAAWWTFGGILLSMLAAVGGAIAGAGPTLVLAGFRVRSTALGMNYPATTTTRETVNR